MRKLSIACIASMIILVILSILLFNTPKAAMFGWLYIIPLMLAVIELANSKNRSKEVLRGVLLFISGLAVFAIATVAIHSLFEPRATPPVVEQEGLDDASLLEQTPSSGQGDDIEQENEFVPPYSEEQLAALGKVMVSGDYVGFAYEDVVRGGMVSSSRGTMTFVDKDFGLAALGHRFGDDDEELLEALMNLIITSHTKDRIERELDDSEPYIGFLSDPFSDETGLYGRMSDFIYDPAKEMAFGLPTVGAAQIFLEMPDNKSGWYEINIPEHYYRDGNYLFSFSAESAFFGFEFKDARLPENFDSYEHAGRSGSPIIQRGRLIGAFSGGIGDMPISAARLAADMRFAQLQRYDENFDAELFRDVPTLKDYFD